MLASNEASAIDQTLESDLALAGNQMRCTREMNPRRGCRLAAKPPKRLSLSDIRKSLLF